MRMDDNDNDEEGTTSFLGKTSNFKEITMDHLRRITKLSSCELRGGYYTTFVTKSGEEKEHYVEDSREALENAIYCLSQLLISRFTTTMKSNFKEFEEECEALKKSS